MSFESKTALVTGGSRGIGRAIALDLASRGCNIAFNYFRSHKAAAQTKLDVEAFGVRCLQVKAHLGDAERIQELFSRVRQAFGSLDILVNNAASGVQRPAVDLEGKHWDWAMNINAKAAWLCAVEAVRLMDGGGHVVNITSLGSQKVLPNYFSSASRRRRWKRLRAISPSSSPRRAYRSTRWPAAMCTLKRWTTSRTRTPCLPAAPLTLPAAWSRWRTLPRQWLSSAPMTPPWCGGRSSSWTEGRR